MSNFYVYSSHMIKMWNFLHQWVSPKFFYQAISKLLPWLGLITLILFVYGIMGGLFFAPADYQQGEGYRIIYVHVPSAFMSLCIYGLMTFTALLDFIWKIKLADMAAKVCANLGAWFTFLALITGAIWGKPMWGTWWVWDARLTSELVLLFLYLGVIALRSAIPEPRNAARACSLLTFIGLVNIPIIHFSVYWWNTLHQGSTLRLFEESLIDPKMLTPLIVMLTAFFFYFITTLLLQMRFEIWKSKLRYEKMKKEGGQ